MFYFTQLYNCNQFEPNILCSFLMAEAEKLLSEAEAGEITRRLRSFIFTITRVWRNKGNVNDVKILKLDPDTKPNCTIKVETIMWQAIQRLEDN